MVDMDGYSTLTTEEDGFYLTIFPAKGKGKKVDLPAVQAELKKHNIPGVKMDIVERAVQESTGQPVIIVEEVIDVKEGQVFVKVDPEDMVAMLTIVPPQGGGAEVTQEVAKNALTEHGVVFGLKDDVIAKLVAKGMAAKEDTTLLLEPIEDIVAEGVSVINGEDAKLELLFESGGGDAKVSEEEAAEAADAADAAAEAAESAAVDYKNVKSIQNVKKGEALAKRILPTNGVNGMTVTGNEIEAGQGKDVKFVFGKGVEPAMGNEELFIASNDGQVVYKNNKLEVLEIYEIQGDVDMSIGNIDFVGTVIVHGGAGEYIIKAGEDVIIEDVADGTEIHAGGKVAIKGGIVGKKAKIIAKGEISAKYIRNAYVETEDSIIVNEAAMHSTLISGKKISVVGARGLLVGGTIAAAHEVTAKEMGAKMATPTEIAIGETPKMREEMNEATTGLAGVNEQLDKTKKGILFLKDLQQKSNGQLAPDKRDLMAKLTRTQFKLMTEQKKWEEVKNKLDTKAKEMQTSKRGKVNCLGMIYTGVKIVINRAQRTVTDELKYSTFVEKNGEIQILPYSG